jgi:hypothetical protein
MISQGIEVVIKKASVDLAFRRLLMDKRADAAKEIGLELSAVEKSMLAAIPAAQLEAVIKSTKVEPRHVAAFLGKVAAVMLATVAVGVATVGCYSAGIASDGIRPDPDRSVRSVSEDANGPTTGPTTQPDIPPPISKGIRPG